MNLILLRKLFVAYAVIAALALPVLTYKYFALSSTSLEISRSLSEAQVNVTRLTAESVSCVATVNGLNERNAKLETRVSNFSEVARSVDAATQNLLSATRRMKPPAGCDQQVVWYFDRLRATGTGGTQ